MATVPSLSAMATTTEPPVALDASGRLRAITAIENTSPEAIAAAVCEVVHDLLDNEASVVSASVLGQGPRGFAMAMLRDVSAGGFLSGTAASEDHADAVVDAVLTALGFGDGVVPAIAERWRALPGITSVSVVRLDPITPTPGTHARLAEAIPAPGLLAVTTVDADYRVLRFPTTAVVVQAEPNAPALDDIDVWMAKAEALAA